MKLTDAQRRLLTPLPAGAPVPLVTPDAMRDVLRRGIEERQRHPVWAPWRRT